MTKINPKDYLALSRNFKANPVLALLEITQKVDTLKLECQKTMQETCSKLDEQVLLVKEELLKTVPPMTTDKTVETVRESIPQIVEAIYKRITPPKNGEPGTPGKPGTDGKTPKEGIDYPSKKQIKEMLKEMVAVDMAMCSSEMKKNHEVKMKEVMDKIKKDFPKVEMITGEQIVKEINKLPITPDKQIDASHIKNLKRFVEKTSGKKRLGRGTSNPVQFYDLTSQCNGVLKTFNIPVNTRVLAVYGTQFPVIFRPLIDWTATTTTLTLTDEVSAPETSQTLFILYVE